MSVGNPQTTKALDTLATWTVIVNIMGWLPTALTVLSTLITITYFSIQIWESHTFKSWRKKK